MRGDELPAGVDYCVFDYAVNSGTGRAPKVLQRLLGIGVTGRMDDATRRARAREARSRDADRRRSATSACAFCKSLKTWPVFGKGWSRRVAEVKGGRARHGRTRPTARPIRRRRTRARPARARCR